MKNKKIAFLEEVATAILDKEQNLSNSILVFANSKPHRYMQRCLKRLSDKPIMLPETYDLESFINVGVSLKKVSNIKLIFLLYDVFKKYYKNIPEISLFYKWLEVFLRDIQEIEHHRINSKKIFTFLKNEKDILRKYDDSDWMKDILDNYISSTDNSLESDEGFWEYLNPVYLEFKSILLREKIAYPALIYSEFLNQKNAIIPGKKIYFIGFNYLTPLEKEIIKYFIKEHKSDIYWDLDQYYLKDKNQEAGKYFREYLNNDPILGKTFSKHIPSNFVQPKEIYYSSSPLRVNQIKKMGVDLGGLLTSSPNIKHEDILVVLTEEDLLFPVLNVIPREIKNINVSAGYPLEKTLLFSFINDCIAVYHAFAMQGGYKMVDNHSMVCSILNHPYIQNSQEREKVNSFIHKCKKTNCWSELFKLPSQLAKAIFDFNKEVSIIYYLLKILEVLSNGAYLKDHLKIERYFLKHVSGILMDLGSLFEKDIQSLDISFFKNIFRKVLITEKIPFQSSEIEGLQIMRVFDTINIDFKYVFIPCLNEGVFPSKDRRETFLNRLIRKNYELPNEELRAELLSYLFYRVIQRAHKIFLYANNVSEFGMSGEKSRWIKQLELESNHDLIEVVDNPKLDIPLREEIIIEKNHEILQKIQMYTNKGNRKLSPSALNAYITCPLQFYFRYVLLLYKKEEFEKNLTPKDIGNIAHEILETLYGEFIRKNKTRNIIAEDFTVIEGYTRSVVDTAIKKYCPQGTKIEGKNLIFYHVINDFVKRVLSYDKTQTPYKILSLEKDKSMNYGTTFCIESAGSSLEISLKGVIDRVDETKDAIRIIDYKTGRDKKELKKISDLFSNRNTKNKTAFQLLYYCWLYERFMGASHSLKKITPCVYNMGEIHSDDFVPHLSKASEKIEDSRGYMNEFETELKKLLEKIYDPEIPFTQNVNDHCKYCDYNELCNIY